MELDSERNLAEHVSKQCAEHEPPTLFKESRQKVECHAQMELDSERNLAEHVSKQCAEHEPPALLKSRGKK